jgi:hypothetical protein
MIWSARRAPFSVVDPWLPKASHGACSNGRPDPRIDGPLIPIVSAHWHQPDEGEGDRRREAQRRRNWRRRYGNTDCISFLSLLYIIQSLIFLHAHTNPELHIDQLRAHDPGIGLRHTFGPCFLLLHGSTVGLLYLLSRSANNLLLVIAASCVCCFTPLHLTTPATV